MPTNMLAVIGVCAGLAVSPALAQTANPTIQGSGSTQSNAEGTPGAEAPTGAISRTVPGSPAGPASTTPLHGATAAGTAGSDAGGSSTGGGMPGGVPGGAAK